VNIRIWFVRFCGGFPLTVFENGFDGAVPSRISPRIIFHVTPKLDRLMTKEGDVVIDPFLGSGTTALAAVKLGRQFLGIGRNEQYIRLAESRIAALSKERE
jgi:hypothetical protein